MEPKEQLKQFTIQFFTGLGATIVEKEQEINIGNVPIKFEKFYGKNAPYLVVFDKLLAKDTNELLTSESHLLKTMRLFLENKGNSSLVRLKPIKTISDRIKNELILNNCEIMKINIHEKYENIFKFTFQTTYAYKNHDDRMLNEIVVKSGKCISLIQSNFIFEETKSKNSDVTTVKEDYEIAKNELKNILKSKTELVIKNLEESLAKERERIDIHFNQQIKEIEEKIKKDNLRKKKGNTSLTEFNEVEALEKKEQLIKEKEMVMHNEERKHGLKIDTKLLNTTLILAPTYSLEIFLKSKYHTKIILLNVNPLDNNSITLPCFMCSKQEQELFFCSGNHLVCKTCGVLCEDCNGISCEFCLKERCIVTNRRICKDCGAVCPKCHSFKHKRFMIVDNKGRAIQCKECTPKHN